ncbi:hypothetical protein I552_9762 [Mycobacterium xenopi 3993]|nr:hypothetical protein I552_9762 [Mycobacterium xenopi 3993]
MTYGVRTLHPLSFPLPSAWDTAISDWVVWLAASGASPATRGCAGHTCATPPVSSACRHPAT